MFVTERLVAEAPGQSDGDRFVARSDLNMLVGTGGRERRESEFAALLRRAGLAGSVATPLTSTYFAIEARLQRLKGLRQPASGAAPAWLRRAGVSDGRFVQPAE
jgi:predicted transcriptional regulator